MTEFDQTRLPQRTGTFPSRRWHRLRRGHCRRTCEHWRNISGWTGATGGGTSQVLIALCGLKLLLPLPIPMSNFFPGISAALLAAGSFEEDGLVFLAGLLMFTASLAYFALLALGGAAAIGEIWQRVVGS